MTSEENSQSELVGELVAALEEVEDHLADVFDDDEPLLLVVRAALARAKRGA